MFSRISNNSDVLRCGFIVVGMYNVYKRWNVQMPSERMQRLFLRNKYVYFIFFELRKTNVVKAKTRRWIWWTWAIKRLRQLSMVGSIIVYVYFNMHTYTNGTIFFLLLGTNTIYGLFGCDRRDRLKTFKNRNEETCIELRHTYTHIAYVIHGEDFHFARQLSELCSDRKMRPVSITFFFFFLCFASFVVAPDQTPTRCD